MKLQRMMGAGILAITLTVGCGDSSEPEVVTIADLVGSWTATSMLFTSQANPSLMLDLINPFVGGHLSITIAADGSFQGTFRESSQAAEESVSGTIAIQGNTITITFVQGLDEDVSGTFTLVGDVLTVSGTFQEFDFTPTDGVDDPEPADLVLVLQRQ